MHYENLIEQLKGRAAQKAFSLLTVLTLLFFAACTAEKTVEPDSSLLADASLAGTWKVISFEDLAANRRVVQDSTNSWGGLDIVLTFRESRISGRNTTNKVSGAFSIPGPGKIQIDAFGGTEIGEPQWGRMFGEAVFKFSAYSVDDKYLNFYYNSGNNIVTLEKQ